MTRLLAASAALLALLCAGPAATQTPSAPPQAPGQAPIEATVAVDAGGDGEALLYGSLLRPAGGGSYPAVLILPAQGSDRNGNASTEDFKPNTYRMLANDLAANGVASLRIDKRGVGASGKAITREEDLRFETYVDDAVTWAKFLKSQPHVNCMAILGHAESGLVAALAAKKIKVCALIEVGAPARPAAAVIAEQLKTALGTKGMDQALYDQAIKILNTLAAGKTVADPPAKLDKLFRPSVQAYLISWIDLDPVEALKTAPSTLILQGSRDFETSPTDAQRLGAAPRYAKIVMVAGADHNLKVAPTEKSTGRAEEALRPISPQASTAIADFLKRLKWP